MYFNCHESEKREKTQTIKEMSRKKIKWEIKNEITITIHNKKISF
jgi:hypothetical protein